MRSVSSVSVESCVSDIVAELPPSFTVPLDQVPAALVSTFASLPDQTVLASAANFAVRSGCGALPTIGCIRKPLAVPWDRCDSTGLLRQ